MSLVRFRLWALFYLYRRDAVFFFFFFFVLNINLPIIVRLWYDVNIVGYYVV